MRSSQGKRVAPFILLAAICLVFHGVDRLSSRLRSTRLAFFVHNQQGNPRAHKLADPRVAICLVGGARAFEITGPSIVDQILHVYGNNSDVFLHAPLDENTYKLFLLGRGARSNRNSSSSRLAAARIFDQTPMPELDFRKQVLTSDGIQGLLQYFNLVEGCWDLITKHERRHGFQYDWIIRTRLDGYWSAPMPPISTFDGAHYTIPYGSQFGGLNDRLGIGTRNSSRIALHRLQCLDRLHANGFQRLNSERAFKAQLQITHTSVQLKKFPFCVVSAKKYDWPPREWGVPVMTMASKGPLNGAKCRPCRAKIRGEEARAITEALNRGWSWSGPNEGVELCDATGDWDADWEAVYDNVVGQCSQLERLRVSRLGTLDECVERLTEFERMWGEWDAPSPASICERKFMI
ncbi:uncharacterized protein LOC9656132 [Selaginella moellendorffii]|uniref:uncharacterized protein LOC9656132 n=1 Tax=Selaginella moellendorffii TaxID=88036 RepID=UPI000D1C558A|nr:uncharacterized protein LOC9656132 [Selaginella moellendorffii]|eukprot:XP_024538142.1 uncharacterized protein LOC9656132 [Selaginella moellendorffii]